MNRAEYSTRRGTADDGGRLADVLAAAAPVDAGGRGSLRAPALLESWPGIVHGGGLAALMDTAARAVGGPTGPRTIETRITSPVPSDTALALEARAGPGATALTVARDGQTLSSGTITPGGAPPLSPPWRGGRTGDPLPMSDGCLACGAANPIGLRVGLSFDAEGVWARLDPPPAPWREGGGRLHPALAAVLLDEVAWWLGALTMREGGLTNRIAIAWRDPDAEVRGPVVGAGRLGDVTPVDRKRTFWRATPALLTEDGAVLATASIVFRGGPEYSGRQLDYFRPRTTPALFARMFPHHAGY